ncbi:hypothetical protein IC3_05000 [Bacillus cereus VD142]|nr:hypothetical protein IC3_05000 [Bacillus cereus VD142]
MIENPMLMGNHHDSSANDFMDYCQGCGGEIYYGEGKSHLCVAATKELMKRGYSAMFIQMNKLFTKIKSTWSKNSELTEDKLMSLLAKVDVLIIDDFGAEFTEKDKEGVTWKQTKTNEIVDSRIGKRESYLMLQVQTIDG